MGEKYIDIFCEGTEVEIVTNGECYSGKIINRNNEGFEVENESSKIEVKLN